MENDTEERRTQIEVRRLNEVVVGLVHELNNSLSSRIESHERRREADNRDHEMRMRKLEEWQARIGGGLALAAILGGALGAAIVKLVSR